MKASDVPPTTVTWKCPGMRSVLCAMILICCVPSVTPVMPPRKPKITTDSTVAENAGLRQGSAVTQPKMPRV